ncbi:hypothetical protein ACIOUE_07130 [Streptomyces xanthochromogenes]|uniref:hypothetical protein n=1 Tax=Streptomyces xanthochromogenes TaxID=67384 RepID=UPI00342BFEA5
MGRHRLDVDSDVVAAVGWWGAIAAGLVLLGGIVQQDAEHGRQHAGFAASALDSVPSDGRDT